MHADSIGKFDSKPISAIVMLSCMTIRFRDALRMSNLVGNGSEFIPMGVYLPLLIRRKSIFVNTVCAFDKRKVVEVLAIQY